MTAKESDSVNNPPAMTDDAGVRDDPRYGVDWQAKIACADWKVAEALAAGNVSRGGMFLRTTRPFDVGARVEVAIELPDQSVVKLLAVVRHVTSVEEGQTRGRPPGIGVEVDAAYRNELMALAEIARLRGGGSRDNAGGAGAAVPPKTGPTPTPAPRRKVRLPAGTPATVAGIDFGATYTSLALAFDDTAYMVPDAFGRTHHPSIVCYPRGDSAVPLVGWDAHRVQLQHPGRTLTALKRLLVGEQPRQQERSRTAEWSYRLVTHPHGLHTVSNDDGLDVSVADACGLVLQHVCELASQQLGGKLNAVVMTHPVANADRYAEGLGQAAQAAGVEVRAIIPEPLAAALAYGHGQGGRELVGVYDLGSSFAFTLLELGAGAFNVLGHGGDPWIGGEAFDLALADAVAHSFWRRTEVELPALGSEWQKLLVTCERVKRRLATDQVASITLPELIKGSKPIDLQQRVDRGALERLVRPLLARTFGICEDVLRAAGVTSDGLSHMVLVGGVCRLPFVRQAVSDFFQREAAEQPQAEDAVGLGAAMFAGRLMGRAVAKGCSKTF